MWLAFAVLSAFFAGITAVLSKIGIQNVNSNLTSVLGKIGIEGINSNLGTAIRTVVVLIMAWIVVFATGSGSTKGITAKSYAFLILSGITTGLSWLCYYRALKYGPATVVVPIDKLSILVTVVFSCIFLGERLTAKYLCGLAMLVCGTFLMIG